MGFKKDFVWGTATASYQVEGGAYEGGRGWTVWDDFCRVPGKVFSGHHGDVAADHYHRLEEDVKLMKELGHKAYRFSIAWSRIYPEGFGEVNPAGLAFYERLIDLLNGHGIEPYVTLFHWDLPWGLYARGGWQNPESVEHFAKYCETFAAHMGEKVTYYITFNEPQCFIGLGHVTGEHAPGNLMSKKAVLEMAHNVLLAHGQGVRSLRKVAPHAKIGYAPTSNGHYPATDCPEDIDAARQANMDILPNPGNFMWNIPWWSDPIVLGRYPEEGVELYKDIMPKIGPDDMEIISTPIDFYCQNIYNGHPIKADGKGGFEYVPRDEGYPRSGNGWPVTPEALYWGPKFLYERYKLPFFISENGTATADVLAVDGKVHDMDRIDFLHRYLRCLKQLVEDGIPVEGYFLWSYLDNFEWAKGYNDRFGIVYVDYKTYERIPKDSAYWYKEVIESNGENL